MEANPYLVGLLKESEQLKSLCAWKSYVKHYFYIVKVIMVLLVLVKEPIWGPLPQTTPLPYPKIRMVDCSGYLGGPASGPPLPSVVLLQPLEYVNQWF
jgi:hypothetical protein